MSVYDFNRHELGATNNSQVHGAHGNSNSNGNQVTKYHQQHHQNNHHQTENDYPNRAYSSTHHLDISVQVTRPTSKTAMLVRQRRAMLEQLSCFLCKGYLIDATTVDECMDSFCKSCIVTYLRDHNNCPSCGTQIHKTNPLSSIRSDKVLQDIVYKLVPGLYDDEMKRRREFYKNIYAISSDEDDEDGSSSSFNGRLSGEQYGVVSHPKSFYKPTDHIDLSIEPQTRGDNTTIYYDNKRQSIVTCFTGNPQQQQQRPSQAFSTVDGQQFKTYLRCPAKLTVLQLKKFIAAKFNICKDDTIHLLYLNESLKDEYSLIDIAYIYDWRGIEHMRLFYIIERDLSKSNFNDSNNNQQIETGHLSNSRPKTTRPSVGTSTQTIKRVCIDPHPKFYVEQNNNVTDDRGTDTTINHGGRLMRSRGNEYPTSVGATKATATSTATIQASGQSPILRSNASSRSGSSSGTSNVNGVSSRELVALRVQATRVPIASAVTSAINELSRLKQDKETKETRSSSRKVNTQPPSVGGATSTTTTIPKININLNSLNHHQTSQVSGSGGGAKNSMHTYSKVNIDLGQNSQMAVGMANQAATTNIINHNIRQSVPWKGYPAITSVPGPSQSSMVTLASFTEARNSHIMAVSTSTATTMSNSYKNLLAPGTSRYELIKPAEVVKNSSYDQASSSSKPPQQPQSNAPQLAFSFVTERGITIIRRLNSHDQAAVAAAAAAASQTSRNSPASTTSGAASVTSASRANCFTVPPSLPAPSTPHQSSGSNIASVVRSNISHYTPTVSTTGQHHSAGPGTSGSGSNNSITTATTTTNMNNSMGSSEGVSPRHLVKVKPVYKTFVDPTKLKSPNFKKLGYTARH